MDKAKLINQLTPGNGLSSIFVFLMGFFIAKSNTGLFEALLFMIPFILIAALVRWISFKLNPEPSAQEMACPHCKKEWSQRHGLHVLADRTCPLCHTAIILN